MRSRALRLTFAAAALITIGAAAFLLIRCERQIGRLDASVRAFDQHAREAVDALADARAAQHAYVAAGQGAPFWTSRVSVTTEAATTALKALRLSAGPGTHTALDEATATIAEFATIDQRVRDYLKSDQPLMAADVIFTEGGNAAATASRQVETARQAEHQRVDLDAAVIRKQEATIAGGAAALVGIIVLLLIPVPRAKVADAGTGTHTSLSLSTPLASVASVGPASVRRQNVMFKAAADLATEFGRVRDLDELRQILGHAAEAMDASGLMVWIGSTSGGDLRPALSHGYSAEMIARIPPVPRSADNAAASAYRTGALQIVLSRPGGRSGAVVAPILSADGCIGALSAELRGGGEASDGIQALASICAAHLAGVLATAPAERIESRAATS
jgi:CHASE3 domain sensor protein